MSLIAKLASGLGLVAVAFLGTQGCASSSGELGDAPAAQLWGEEVTPSIGVRTYVVLDERLEAQAFRTRKSYPRSEGQSSPIRIRTGLGMKRSLENRLSHTFRNVAFMRTMQAAVAGLPEQGKAEVILWPRLATAEVSDDGGTTTAEVELTVLLTTSFGAPLERINVHIRNSAAAPPAAEDDEDPNRTRLVRAVSVAYDRALAELSERLERTSAFRAIVEAKTKPMRLKYAVDYAAAVQCAKDEHRPAGPVELAFGRDDTTVRRAMDHVIAAFGDEEHLAVYLLTCEEPGTSPRALLEKRLLAVGEKVDSGDLEAARTLLEPLALRGGSQALVRAMSERIDRVEREREEAAERARLEAEAAERAKREEEERRIAEEQARREEQERIEREAAEQAQKQAEADTLARSARKSLKRGKYDGARDDAMRALQIIPNHVEARTVIQAIAQHERDVEQKRRAQEERKRKRELARIQAQVPRLIKKCDEMKRRFEKAQEKEREAAVSGNPTRVESMARKRQKASSDFVEARAKVLTAIQAYRDQGHHDAAEAVRRSARRPCNL